MLSWIPQGIFKIYEYSLQAWIFLIHTYCNTYRAERMCKSSCIVSIDNDLNFFQLQGRMVLRMSSISLVGVGEGEGIRKG